MHLLIFSLPFRQSVLLCPRPTLNTILLSEHSVEPEFWCPLYVCQLFICLHFVDKFCWKVFSCYLFFISNLTVLRAKWVRITQKERGKRRHDCRVNTKMFWRRRRTNWEILGKPLRPFELTPRADSLRTRSSLPSLLGICQLEATINLIGGCSATSIWNMRACTHIYISLSPNRGSTNPGPSKYTYTGGQKNKTKFKLLPKLVTFAKRFLQQQNRAPALIVIYQDFQLWTADVYFARDKGSRVFSGSNHQSHDSTLAYSTYIVRFSRNCIVCCMSYVHLVNCSELEWFKATDVSLQRGLSENLKEWLPAVPLVQELLSELK